MNIVIRDFADADGVFVLAILREMQAAELPYNARMKPVAAIGDWYVALLLEIALQRDSAFLVAETTGKCVGFAFLLLNEMEKGDQELGEYSYAHVTELGVLASARGQGVGLALLEECERRARLAGRDELTLAVYADNEPAHNLYRKAGFADFKIRMRKALG